ncbi:MAG: tetratricopeptide repeat protein [Bryobacteraceae bacterium]|nr:tetratricopeptide repeat protein [Bryobacteraceae bacterium]
MRLVALFALLSFTACAQQKATPKKRVAVASTGAAASEAARAEALWKAGRFQDAVYAFQASIKANPDDPKTRVRLGDLFRERFQPKDAGELYGEALEIDEGYVPALMGLARVFAEGWDRRAEELAQKAAKLAPQDAEPLELLARLAAEDSNFTLAVEQADKALALSPNAFEAMGVRGAIDILEDRNPSPWLERALKADPARGQAYNVAGELLVINRRYNEGIDLFRKATEVQPTFWEARARLGVNLMRLGKDEEARRELELCYENGYKSNPVVNTLRLMDSYKNFKTFRTDRAIVRLHKKEADVLEPYIVPEVERVMSAYDKKYGYTMKAPVQLEVYPDHEDFAVRTMGMPGLGALGVSFGPVVAMDSPSGRKAGSFHWASTLWHEMSHVYALAITNYRVPRWFTEGLAVYEETAVSPDWGDRLDPPTIVAIRDKKLLPVEKLDRGFIRPSYPAQVTVSYFQGGRICSYIAQNWGYPKLIEMLNDYGKGETTAKIFPARLGIAPAEFDKRFIEWVEKETEKTVSGFKEWQGRLKTLVAASREENWDAVLSAGPALRDIYPEYVEAGNVYELIYRAHLAKNDKAAAMAELKRYSKAAGRDPDLLKALAKLEEESGDKKAAAATLNRLLYIAPAQDEELHRRLGDLLIEQGDHLGAVREYRAVVASKPVNPAAAYYSLARAYRAAHQPERAKEALFAALEAAPGYRPAQKMLLELSSAK